MKQLFLLTLVIVLASCASNPENKKSNKYLSAQEIEDIYSTDKLKDKLILQWISIPNIKLLVWDYDKTILKEHSSQSLQLNDPYFLYYMCMAIYDLL